MLDDCTVIEMLVIILIIIIALLIRSSAPEISSDKSQKSSHVPASNIVIGLSSENYLFVRFLFAIPKRVE